MEHHFPVLFFSSRRLHTRFSRDWSSDVCSSDLIPRARAVAIAIAAAEAVAHVHRAGWVHGDINPGNLVVDARIDGDHVVLIDFGVSRRTGTGGTVRGTHAYMAPEQVRGEVWTPSTDVFAL